MGATGVEHKSNKKRIWTVFIYMSVLTIVEVVLGIYKPDSLHMVDFLSLSILNWIFIILTIVKAYYIMWAFMHLEGETAGLRWSVVGTLSFLCVYMITLILIEGNYIFDVFNNDFYKWIF